MPGTGSALDSALRAARRKSEEENRRKKATEDARRRSAAERPVSEGRTKDDDVRREPVRPPQRVKDDTYTPPQQNKVFVPTWRSSGPPPGATDSRQREYGPPAPIKRPETWRSPAPSFGDREELSSDLQVGLTSPRPNTGPTGIGGSTSSPTLTTPTITPWRPPQWNMQEERDNRLGAPSPTWGRNQEGPPAAAPAFGFLGWADPIVKGVGAVSNAVSGATDSFTNSAAYEKMQRDMELRRQEAEAREGQSFLSQAGDWWKDTTAGVGERWNIAKNVLSGETSVTDAYDQMSATAAYQPTVTDVTEVTRGLNMGADDMLSVMQAGTDYAMTRPMSVPGQTDYLNRYVLGGKPAEPAKPLEDTTVGATIVSSAEGAWAGLKDAFMNTQGGNTPWQAARKTYLETQARYAQGTAPTAQQQQQATAQEITRQRERSYLNWADPSAVAKTFDALVDAPAQAASLQQQAQQLMEEAKRTTDPKRRQELVTAAADAGREAYKRKNAHPIDTVNENTNLWRQMAFEVLLPDITDLAGGLISVAGMAPKARRANKVASEVFQPEAKIAEALNRIAPVDAAKKIATGVEESRYNKFFDLWTVGQARADIDAAEMMKVTSTLLADADTASDARILLTQLARDPKKLVTGIAANLFQSTGLLARADADGMIRFGSTGLNNKTVQTALNSFRAIADDFLANADVLNKDGMINKVDAAMSMAEAVRQGGYRVYDVATELGNMPLGSTSVKVKPLEGGQAVLEYYGKDKKLLSTSDPMTLIAANKQAVSGTKAIKNGATAQASFVNQVGALQRKAVSPFYIYLSPGTWATNIVNAAATAMGDGSMIWGGIQKMQDHTAKLYGGIKPTLRSMEGVETAANVAGQTGSGGLLGPLKKAYSGVEEFFGERVAYKSMTHAFQKFGPKVVEQSLAPILQAYGVDPKLTKTWANRLFEVGYQGGNMTDELAKLMTGNSKAFSVTDVNPAYLEALDNDSLTKLYDVIRTSPDAATAQTRLAELFDNARNPWEQIIGQAPPTHQRYTWQKLEGQQDMADATQISNNAQKYAGVSPEEAKAFREARAAATQAVDQKMDSLTAMVMESSDPNNRYLLYSTWGQIYDETTKTRMLLAEAAENAYETKDWTTYWTTAQQAWAGRNEKVNKLLDGAGVALHSGQPVNANFGVWDILERTAKRNEQILWQTLRLEPQSGRYDQRLAQVIEAGRALTDKAVARTYAAARRFNGPSGFDEIVSAEKSVQIAGGNARRYIDQALQQALKTGKWEDYYGVRNETWRQLRQYEAGVWKMAERSIIEEGLGLETKTGLKFDYMGEQVELVRPVQKDFEKTVLTGPRPETVPDPQAYWQVKRPDGKLDTIPDAQVPAELKAKYKGATPDDIEAEIGMELDNVASGATQAPAAQNLADAAQPGKTLWRTGQIDRPVTVTGVAEQNGNTFYTIEGSSQLVPESQLFEVMQDGKMRKVSDSEALRATQETVQLTTEEVAAAQEALGELRREWDRTARAHKGYLKLENAVGLYAKDGIARVPENKFEDLYGTTVAGRQIENQADVEALLSEYAKLKKQVRTKRKTIQDSRQAYTDAWNATEDVDIKRIQNDLNFGAQATEEVSRKTSRATTAAGGALPPDQSLAAQHALDMLEALRTHVLGNLDEIMRPAGKVSEGQLFNVVNQFKQKVIPQWDNLKYAASEYSDRMRSFTMVDFRNRTRMDEILGLGTPYSFWFTRAVKNSAERMVFEPHIWRRVQQTEAYISKIREQQGDPQRYDGAIPITIGDKTFYLRVSPSKYWSVFPNMIQNDYADPEKANSAMGFAMDSAQSVGFNYYPWLDAAKKVSEGKANDIYAPSYLPQGTMLANAAQYMGVDLPGWARPQYGEYNSGREALLALVGNEKIDGQAITPEEVQLVEDYFRQQKTGESALPGQAITPRLRKIIDLAEQRSAGKNLVSNVSSWATGVNVKPYDPNERQIMEAKQTYQERGYDPTTNPYGSKEAKSATFDEAFYLSPAYSLGAIYNKDQVRPGASAEAGMKGKESDRLYAEMNQAVQDAIRASGGKISKDAVDDIKQPYQDQIEALKAKYPNAAYPESMNPTKGMNPQEQAEYAVRNVLTEKPEGEPQRPAVVDEKNLTPAEAAARRKYYAEYEKWNDTRLDLIERNLAAMLGTDETEYPGITSLRGEIAKLVKGKYASELLRKDKLRFATETERNWADKIAIEQEMTSQEFAQREAQVKALMGAAGVAALQQYYDTPEGEARQKLKEANPLIAQAQMAAYNPDEYQEAIKLFGKDAWSVFYSKDRPQHPGDEATEAQLQTYYKTLDKFNAANPKAAEINMWVNGRQRWSEKNSSGSSHKDYGNDYEEAIRIFGPNIFQVVANMPDTDDKKVIARYYDAHPELSGYWEWNKDLKEPSGNISDMPTINWGAAEPQPNASFSPVMQNAGQPRPLGSGREPVGESFPLGSMGNWGSAGQPTNTPASSTSDPSGALLFSGDNAPGSTSSPTAATGAAKDDVVQWPDAGDKTALDYARQNPKFVENEAREAGWAAQNAALDKQFGDGTSTKYQQYLDLPKGSDERKQFLRDNPDVRLAMAWMYGRDTDEKGKGDNNGADYLEAKNLFGDGIWDLYAQYDSRWSKAQKKAFYDQHPEYGEFTDWWYGDDGKGDYVRRSYVRSGSSGGGGGGYSSRYGGKQYSPDIYARKIDDSLMVDERDIRPWRPQNIDYGWMSAGRELQPDKLRPWRP